MVYGIRCTSIIEGINPYFTIFSATMWNFKCAKFIINFFFKFIKKKARLLCHIFESELPYISLY